MADLFWRGLDGSLTAVPFTFFMSDERSSATSRVWKPRVLSAEISFLTAVRILARPFAPYFFFNASRLVTMIFSFIFLSFCLARNVGSKLRRAHCRERLRRLHAHCFLCRSASCFWQRQ